MTRMMTCYIYFQNVLIISYEYENLKNRKEGQRKSSKEDK